MSHSAHIYPTVRDYPMLANLLLIPVQFALVRWLPGLGLDGALGPEQRVLFMVLAWAGLILEFPALALHVHLARHLGAPGGFSRIVWVLVVFRVILLLVLSVLALNAVGLEMNHWLVRLFLPAYGLIYVLFCFFTAGSRPSGREVERAFPMPETRRFVIGAFAAFWNLALLTALWTIIEGEFMAGQPLPGARTLVIVLMALLALMLYVPARLPYLLVERAGLGDGLRRVMWYVIFVANVAAPIVAAYTR